VLKLSGCVIAMNEEAHIEECLRSLAFCDEVVVVDSHSKDRTRELAAALGVRVIEHDWEGHIGQKNFAVDQAANDWVLCVDADERVTPELASAVKRTLESEPACQGYEVGRRNVYLGAWIKHGGWYPDSKVRLFDRRRARWGGVNPHDHVQVQGKTGNLGADLIHLSYRDLSHHLTKAIDFFSTVSAREKLARGQRFVTLQLLFGPPLKFAKMFFLRLGFLDGWRGFIVAVLGAFFVFLKYAKLWELIHVKGERPGLGEKVTYAARGETAPAEAKRP
jgi:glycosyltransferase involved in cell wall biosynthesis